MADLHVDFLGKRLAGPVVAASGTFGFGPEYADIEDLRLLGGISGKGLTLNGQPGNEGERLYETPSGLMNSIGLQNPGVQHFIDRRAARGCWQLRHRGLGQPGRRHTIEDYERRRAAMLGAETDVDFIELNISCPNVKQGGHRLSASSAASAREVVSAGAGKVLHQAPDRQAQPPGRETSPEMCRRPGRGRRCRRHQPVQHLPGLRH